MFDVGFSELVMILLVALIVIGPKNLPQAARIAGLWISKFRNMATKINTEIKQELHAEEMKQIIKEQQQSSTKDLSND